jgi:type VI secretion system protein VasD
MTSRILWARVLFVGALSACGAAPAPSACETPAILDVAIESGPLLNPDAEGRALPTEVRLYRVRDASVFETLSFDAVWQSDADALGDALVGVESVTLYPGETTHGAIAPGDDARALVAMAVVREPAGHTWRTIVDVAHLPCGASAQVRLRVDEYRIESTPVAAGED